MAKFADPQSETGVFLGEAKKNPPTFKATDTSECTFLMPPEHSYASYPGMKNLKLVLLLAVATVAITLSAFSSNSSAEEFQLTRGDGKVFTCSDQGFLPVAPPLIVPICDCTNEYNVNNGKVVGNNTETQCQLINLASNQSRLASCTSFTATEQAKTITCTCLDDFGTDYGSVAAEAKNAEQLSQTCKNKAPASKNAKLISCNLSL